MKMNCIISQGRKGSRWVMTFMAISLSIVMMDSCRGDWPSGPRQSNHQVEIELKPGYWVYYSVDQDCIVGECRMNDASADAEWAKRLDWDFAVSEDGFRTNSGSSGQGRGGLIPIASDSLFENMLEVPVSGYYVDSLSKVYIPEELP